MSGRRTGPPGHPGINCAVTKHCASHWRKGLGGVNSRDDSNVNAMTKPRPTRYIRTMSAAKTVPNLRELAVSSAADDQVEAQRSAEPKLSDAELVEAVRAGRRAAFDELIERYQRRAVSVAYRLLGNLHDALEVCQEAFIRAYRNLESLEDGRRFGPWLLRIVTNLSLNFRRDRAVAGQRVSLDDCILDKRSSRSERLADPAHSATRPGAELAASELHAVVQAAIARLPTQQRTALVLFSIEQLPQKEVASIMECSVEAVKWHVFQARKKLKDELAEYL
jgi:RNA polymerase sigma-70 factor (ECF subfamily)